MQTLPIAANDNEASAPLAAADHAQRSPLTATSADLMRALAEHEADAAPSDSILPKAH